MESEYDKVVKLTAEILKSWKSDPGTLSPFSSSSSSHTETSDNHLEHYVKQNVTSENSDIASMFNADLFTNGGEKMTEKTLDVDSSTTTQQQYSNPGVSTTEPDPQSEIAITKADVPQGANDESGKGTYSTTANTTTEAPSAGETTEPVAKSASVCPHCGGDSCPDCGKAMHMCMCDGMSKSDSPANIDAVTAPEEQFNKDVADGDADDDDPMGLNKASGSMSDPQNGAGDDSSDDDAVEKKEFSDKRRSELADSGKALPDGSFPIESEQDLKNAIQAFGRAKDPAKAKAHIISRAKALGKENLLPEDWTGMKKSLWGGAFAPSLRGKL